MKSKELREQRAKLIADARKLLDTAKAAGREMDAEEQRQFDAMMDDADKRQVQYEKIERLEVAEAQLAESRGRVTESEQPGRTPGTEAATTDKRGTSEYRDAFGRFLNGEVRAAHVADNDATGGYMVAPTQTVNELIKFVDNMLVIRQLATVHTVTAAQSLGAVSFDTDLDDGTWTSELNAGTEDTAMRFGKRELHPHLLTKLVKLSDKLISLTSGGAEQLVRERLAYKIGVTQEKNYMTGSGVNQPLGLFTASANGISTARDESTGNTTTALTGDGLINALYKLKPQYQASKSLRWIFHRDAVKMIRKLKSTDNQYIWMPGLSGGQPDSILGVPMLQSEYAPNTFTTGLYVGLVGDLKYYWIADAMALQVKRLVELYAATNQVGYIGQVWSDAMPVLEEAFVRVTLA